MVGIPILMGRLYKYSNKKKYQYTCAATLRRTEQASILVLFLLGCRNVMGPIKIGWLIFKRVRRLDNP